MDSARTTWTSHRRTSSASCSTSTRRSGSRRISIPTRPPRRRCARYKALWHELTREETFGPDERFKLDERLHSLNDLGFDVEEIQLEATPNGYRLRLDPHVVEPGHHRHRLLRLTGLDAQENQARRMLNDIARYREALQRREKRPIGEAIAASRWRQEVFEPTVAAVPESLWAALPAAEVFHQVLEHRWFLSEQAGKDVGIDEAVRSYVERELPTRPAERVILDVPEPD